MEALPRDNQIIKLSSLLAPAPNFYHWRSHGGAEVDLIIEYNGRFFPVEIKANSRPRKSDARGIGAFRDTYSAYDVMPGLVLAPSEDVFALTDNDFCIPWDVAYK
jgi:hypothetical protein